MKIKKEKLFIILATVIISILIATIVVVYINKSKKSQVVYNDNTESLNTFETNEEEDLNNVDDETTVEEQPEENEIEEPENNAEVPQPTNTNVVSQYYIKVNYQANTVTIYRKESNGGLTPIKAMICSCGTATPTSGVYKTSDKYEWGWLINGVFGRYSTRIVGSILFHSVPYTENKNKASLEYWEYDKLGTTASAGCVRLTIADAKWIYTNCPKATEVEFYASSDPGPLGKPTAQKISDNIECRDWDPTDDSPESPWHSWSKKKEEQEKQKEEEKKKEQPKNEVVQNNTIKNEIKEENKNSVNINQNTIKEEKNEVNVNNTAENNINQNNTITNNKIENEVKENNNVESSNVVEDNKITDNNINSLNEN